MQTIIPHRHLTDITDEEIKDVCQLSGEVDKSFWIEKIDRVRDEDENIRVINAVCKSKHIDSFSDQEYFQAHEISINPAGIVWVVNLTRETCGNICRRDVICNQYEVMFYLMLKGFDFSVVYKHVEMFMTNRAQWNELDPYRRAYQ